jgi:cytochrome c-type biogenesis protein CcmH/NrfG
MGKNKKKDKLTEYCLEELENDPKDDSLLWQLGDAYLQSENYQKALELGRYHYQIHPESPNAIQIIISALEGLKEPVENFSWKGSPR